VVGFVNTVISGSLNNKRVMYGCKTWSLALREEHRLRNFENRVLRKMDHGENCILMNFMVCILLLILLGLSNQE
jgi:hypothetical protein